MNTVRRCCLIGAGLALLAADAGVLLAARRNRSAPTGGTLELTERELRLAPALTESTAMELELRWTRQGLPFRRQRTPPWLDAAKLRELGFDCHLEPTAPFASRHYRARNPAWAWLVLEHRPDSPAPALLPRDAGRDPARLRNQYPDPERFLLVRAVIRATLLDFDPEQDTPVRPPRLQGVIQGVLPDRISVPSEFSPVLQPFRRTLDPPDSEPRSEDAPPRFAARIAWGTRGEPWILSVRRLDPPPAP